jgi:ribosomal protein L11 methyltransferase
MNQEYVYVTLSSKEELFENIIAILSNFPILGIEEIDDNLKVAFKKENWDKIDKEFFLEALKVADPNISISQIDKEIEKNWNEEWEKNVTPVILSDKIAVAPSWRKGSTGKPIEIIIDPKMSFGTGHHSTTKLMVQLAEKYVKPNSFWIDVGTGTGILAIVANKLGAKEVLAFDNNPWSIANASENFRLNNIDSGIDLIEMDLDTLPNLPECDGIFANLNYELVIRNLGKFHSAIETKKGVALISGILIYDSSELEEIALKKGFKIIDKLTDQEWSAFALTI